MLGSAVAKRLANEGYEVWLHYGTNEAGAKALAKAIEDSAGKRVRTVGFDVTDASQIEETLVPLLLEHGPIDVLVNNAAVTSQGYMAMLPVDRWNEVMSVNLGGFFLVTRAVLKGMMRKRAGRIINIGSLAGTRASVGQVAYAASKAGLEGATRALAMEVARWNILVNTVAPGPLTAGMAEELDMDELKKQIPLGRLGDPAEVAGVVAFLCGEDASYLTGQVISVNGGMGM